MNQVVQFKRLNQGRRWSEMDVADLLNGIRRGQAVWLVADFLERNEQEVRKKMAELGIEELPPLKRALVLCDELETYNFQCEAGPLKNALDWQDLRRILVDASSG